MSLKTLVLATDVTIRFYLLKKAKNKMDAKNNFHFFLPFKSPSVYGTADFWYLNRIYMKPL